MYYPDFTDISIFVDNLYPQNKIQSSHVTAAAFTPWESTARSSAGPSARKIRNLGMVNLFFRFSRPADNVLTIAAHIFLIS
jgi:hypothetical protein